MNSQMEALLIFSIICFLPHCNNAYSCPGNCSCGVDPEFYGILVNCTAAGFVSIPVDIPVNTTALLMSGNKLKDIQNDTFSKLINLKMLDLSNCGIDKLHQRAFEGLNELLILNLKFNPLHLSQCVYPPGIFQPLVRLKVLYLGNKQRLLLSGDSIFHSREKAGSRLLFRGSKHSDVLILANDETNVTMSDVLTLRGKPLDSDEEYPDQALSDLASLEELYVNGLTNKTFGPGFKMMDKLTTLNLDGAPCNIITITNETFATLPHLEHLNLSSCNVQIIAPDAFSVLVNLTTLDLSENCALGFDLLGEVFRGLAMTKLQNLIIDNIVHKNVRRLTISKKHMQHFRNIVTLQTVQAENNKIEDFEDGVLCNCTPHSLRKVDLNGNPLIISTYFKEFRCLQSLETLLVNGLNSVLAPSFSLNNYIPIISSPESEPYRPFIKDRLKVESISQTGFILPPLLKHLQVKHFGLFYKFDSECRIDPHNSLSRIEAKKNRLPFLTSPVTGLENLTELYLQDVYCKDMSPVFLNSFTRLEVLDVSGNPMQESFENDVEGEMFRSLLSLKTLVLSRINLGHIHSATLRPLHNLAYLDLSVNVLGAFSANVSHMKHLTYLNLSHNMLTSLPKETRDHLDSVANTRNVTVDMTFNNIPCVCENIDFLRWIHDSKVSFGTYSNYICLQGDGSSKQMTDIMALIVRLEKECADHIGVFWGASTSCLLGLSVILMAVAYRFRWKLRYLYYVTRLNFKNHLASETDIFEFDAFVSFASEDANFVMAELKTQLEDKFELRLCIHTRDFTPGQYIASNIVDAIQHSRHTLIVLTRALLESDWCNYELQMALMEGAHTGRDVLLFLLYDDLPSHELPREILFNIQSHTYIEFPHNEFNMAPFWNRIVEALRE